MKNDILDSFTTLHPDLDRWRVQTEAELVALLAQHNIAVQLVSSRTKDLESLRKKLARPDKIYARLTDITDLVGVRVATCFEDAIDDVARVIEQAWRVDFTHSTDKLRFVDHRFGYRSLHYVCAPHDDAGLPEGFRFEIQIRTVLQHAWAEVEHDLGYKASTAVPELIRRRFSRIASLLEIADQEFVSIRNDLVLYEQQVREALEHPDRAADVDIVSLRAVVRTDLVDTLDRALSRALDKPMGKAPWNPDYLTRLLRLAGLTTTREVLDAVDRHTACALQLVAPYFEFAQARWATTRHRSTSCSPATASSLSPTSRCCRARHSGSARSSALPTRTSSSTTKTIRSSRGRWPAASPARWVQSSTPRSPPSRLRPAPTWTTTPPWLETKHRKLLSPTSPTCTCRAVSSS